MGEKAQGETLVITVQVFLNVQAHKMRRAAMLDDEKQAWYFLSDYSGKRLQTLSSQSKSAPALAPVPKSIHNRYQPYLPQYRGSTAHTIGGALQQGAIDLSQAQILPSPGHFQGQGLSGGADLGPAGAEGSFAFADRKRLFSAMQQSNPSQPELSGFDDSLESPLKRPKPSGDYYFSSALAAGGGLGATGGGPVYSAALLSGAGGANGLAGNNKDAANSSDYLVKRLFETLTKQDATQEMDPSPMLQVKLRPYQKQALAWLVEREKACNTPNHGTIASSLLYYIS
jgi:hypothetical protein